jgi:hypothetical protein
VSGLFSSENAEANADADGTDKAFETKQLSIVKKCGESNGYSSGVIVKADYPVGNSVVAQAVTRWIAGYSVGSGYTGDLTDGNALFEQYAKEFEEGNSTEDIKKYVAEMSEDKNAKGDEESFEWYDDIKIVKEYDGKYIVSYTYQWSGFHVGNATSNASIKDCTFSKIDGSTLGWEMFTSKSAVKELIDKALIDKYGREGADLYDNGIPMPKAPLFMKDSVRFDYSDYTIAEPHYYEEYGSFPYCSIAYKDMMNVLTDEAKQYLGLGGGKPKARKLEGVVAGKMQDFLSEMDNNMNKYDADNLDIFYSDTWTDVSQQWIPAAWGYDKNTAKATLAAKVKSYTTEVLNELVTYGATPDFRQIGNEVSYGMLWDNASGKNKRTNLLSTSGSYSTYSNQITRFATLLKAAA